jgi:hypothetical protein
MMTKRPHGNDFKCDNEDIMLRRNTGSQLLRNIYISKKVVFPPVSHFLVQI